MHYCTKSSTNTTACLWLIQTISRTVIAVHKAYNQNTSFQNLNFVYIFIRRLIHSLTFLILPFSHFILNMHCHSFRFLLFTRSHSLFKYCRIVSRTHTYACMHTHTQNNSPSPSFSLLLTPSVLKWHRKDLNYDKQNSIKILVLNRITKLQLLVTWNLTLDR